MNDVDGSIVQVIPPIRPEDLSRQEQSLMTPVMTFGGAYIEDFGQGISTIQISGHTGWRGNQVADGIGAFEILRDIIWVRWHADRAAAVEAGRSPDTVRLVFVDGLDNIVSVVVPGSFSLKRSKSRPLLMQYQISMTVLTDRLDQAEADALRWNGEPNVPAGTESLTGSIETIRRAADRAQAWVQSELVVPVRSFLERSTAVFQMVNDAAAIPRNLINGVSSQLVGVAADLAQVGRNAFYTYNAVAGLPVFAMHEAARVAAAFENVFCIMRNVFRIQPQYPEYSGLYGASVCSSTIGGSPLSQYRGQNPFETIIPSDPPPPNVSAVARQNIDALVRTDPVLAPMPVAELGPRLGDIAEGVVLP